MAESRGMEYLRRKLILRRSRVLTRYKFYEMKNQVPDFGISTPPGLRLMKTSLGWCGKAVDALADRLIFRTFGEDNFELNRIYQMNNPDVLFDAAILAALIGSCSFLYISPDESGYPRLQVLDGSDATGVIDPITNMLQEGYAVLKRDDAGQPVREAYFLPGKTVYYEGGREVRADANPALWPLLVPVIYRPDAKRPFGHSRISRACMDIVRSAQRSVKRAEVSAEFYSYPQKYVLGTSQDLEPMEKWKASMSALLEFTKDEEGDHPTVGQFTQQSMSPHTEQIRMFAALFAGETGLTLDDLGFVTDNPSSAEAIKASHENLRLTARKAQRTFGSCFLNAGYLAACLRDGFPYERRQIYLTTPKWEPVFEPDAAALAVIGDGIAKINQAVPGCFSAENLRDLTGIGAGQ
ncbi:MAG: hypothetical protein ACI3U8_02170 [Candidatus Onthomonas sp.]